MIINYSPWNAERTAILCITRGGADAQYILLCTGETCEKIAVCIMGVDLSVQYSAVDRLRWRRRKYSTVVMDPSVVTVRSSADYYHLKTQHVGAPQAECARTVTLEGALRAFRVQNYMGAF